MTKVIQITPATGGDDMRAVCDNGEIWARRIVSGHVEWRMLNGPYPIDIPPPPPPDTP